ncbi:hypothetical protein [Papillibacter cinnamivorans]|uniref:DUF4309 domain-containing protein n=1 Tax=Papillibacter cinnamivorans DSM 12816 TaxID=1122930 RepID=A0A1W2BBI1_9FIRM|nr:hypothetical protein [Papillibacter cinnamivorans]SMC70266.1 hypothetical protein SAMN02745168_2130 [Papillibacter cinnamivorans DSM 12816]
MKTALKKKSYLVPGSILLVLVLILAGLSGCGSSGSSAGSNGTAAAPTPELSPSVTEEPAPTSAVTDAEGESLDYYVSLLGLGKGELADVLGENPVAVDEGGAGFEKAGVRAWFDGTTGKANQIFTDRKDIDLDGVKLGDSIDRFEEKFGDPVSDRNGDMHFKYGDVFLSVIYDEKTKETVALYILQEDF